MPDFLIGVDCTFIWLIVLIVFVIVEASTVNLVSVWFALGSLAALAAAAWNASLWVQIAVFVAVSLLSLILTRPLVKKFIIPKHISTNFERIIGMNALVTEEINNSSETGAVHIDGKEWSARSENGSVLAVGERVRILRIEGVKVIVLPENNG